MRVARISAAAALALVAATASANVLFSDNFDTYNTGPLDKNLATGPNAAPNGSGNPWFGPSPPNAQVVNTEQGITPASGTHMIRGSAPSDFDQNWYNLAYRLNADQPFPGNLRLDVQYYDPAGAGDVTVKDFISIGYYDTVYAGADYNPATPSLNPGVQSIQRVCLGASSYQAGDFDANVYQVRVVGASDGYANGWFNTTVQRSIGWHHMRIDVGPALSDGTNDLKFFIDNMTTPILEHNSVEALPWNELELNLNYGGTSAYYDSLQLSYIGVPGDANFDGTINGDDYAAIDRGFARHLNGFRNGDFNGDFVINAADYLLIDTSYGKQTGQLPASLLETRLAEFGPDYVAALTAAVPEPSTLGLLGMGLALLARRRRNA